MTINQISELFLKNIEKEIALIIEKKNNFHLNPLFEDPCIYGDMDNKR